MSNVAVFLAFVALVAYAYSCEEAAQDCDDLLYGGLPVSEATLEECGRGKR